MNFNKILGTIFAAIFIVCSISYATAQETVQDNTVRIKIGGTYGSGAYIGDRLILSCAHLYNGESTKLSEVWFKNGEHHFGKLINIDIDWDQSLIELDTKPSKNGIPISTVNPKPGELVHAYGYGKQNTIMATTGYVKQYVGNQRDKSAADWFALTGAVEEGSSGGPIVNTDGYIIGNLWGTDGYETVGLCTGRTRIFLSPWRSRLASGRCQGGICYPPQYNTQPIPQQPPNLIPLPQQPPSTLEPLPEQAPVVDLPIPDNNTILNNGCNCPQKCPGLICKFDPQKVADILKRDAEFVASIKGDKGDQGEPGLNGADGKDAEITNEHLAAMTAAIIQQLKSDQEFIAATTGPQGQVGNDGPQGPQGPPGPSGDATLPDLPDSETGWSHLVLVAPTESDYWYRLEYDYNKAAQHYNQIRHVEPPTDRNIGPMPLLVAYRGGVPAKSWVGLRDVSQALNYITRGEYDEFLLAEKSDGN